MGALCRAVRAGVAVIADTLLAVWDVLVQLVKDVAAELRAQDSLRRALPGVRKPRFSRVCSYCGHFNEWAYQLDKNDPARGSERCETCKGRLWR